LGASFDGVVLLMAAAWLALQALALWKLRGAWRLAAWVPLAAMGLALAVAILGVLAGSDLAPIWVVFALPFCLLWIATLWLLRAIDRALAR
jgi:hypothetical protein